MAAPTPACAAAAGPAPSLPALQLLTGPLREPAAVWLLAAIYFLLLLLPHLRGPPFA